MGYALFTARKLSLQARVNQLNAQLMVVSNQQDSLTQQITNKQMKTNLETAEVNANLYAKYAKKEIDESSLNEQLSARELEATMSNLEIQKLQSKVDALDTARESYETLLTAAQQELSSVEKAEESGIKGATPKYTA